VTGWRGYWTRLLACLAAALVVASCASDDSPGASTPSSTGQFAMGEIDSEYSGSGPTVVVLGDSIADLSRRELHRVLDPHYRTKIAAA
jgi:hypothetical protein